jgi:mRNA-degrading endonuclease RelE of RelBE toxin-antitoxin system
MAYRWLLVIGEEAQEQVDELDRNDLMLVFDKLAELLNAENPTNKTEVTDIKRLKAPEYEGLWRKRAGDWRILYKVQPGHVIHLKWEYKGRLILAAILNCRDL